VPEHLDVSLRRRDFELDPVVVANRNFVEVLLIPEFIVALVRLLSTLSSAIASVRMSVRPPPLSDQVLTMARTWKAPAVLLLSCLAFLSFSL
jgi:hypothetical protein